MRTVLFLLCSLLSMTLHAQAISRSTVELQTPTGVLHGSLVLPRTSHTVPVALLIAGSGPTDRDGNNPMGHNDSLRLLAQALAQHGIASVRYDKRGIAASQAAAPNEETLTIDGYADDVVAWTEKLSADSRFSRIVLIGHSEGALVATLAANRSRANALVLIAGSGRPLDKVLEEQLSTRLPPGLLAESRTILDSLKAGRPYPIVDPQLHVIFRPSVQPFLMSWLRHDPSKALASVAIPTLIVQGDHDVQVGTRDAEALKSAKTDAHLQIIGGMNHVLRITPKDFEQQRASYNDPRLPVARQLTDTIRTFIANTEAEQPSS